MDVFDLVAKITLDKAVFDKSLRDAQKNAEDASGSISKGFSKISTAMKTLGKVGVASLGTASAAVVSLTKKSVAAFKEYQQLVGGVKTLFGTQDMSLEQYAKSVGQTVEQAQDKYNDLVAAQNLVEKNARQAFSSAGMSVNEYMEMATSTAAAMVSSLNGDTLKAAELTDQAIRDMSDNANKMGTNMESIQNAYNGFAKGNFTMLDNLKLGFGGTKEEMQRLLDKASEISGFQYDISSYADIVEAIHVVQDEMGITGTTAAEAAQTVSGSAGSMKAAWENLILAIGDGNNDIKDEVADLVASATTMVDNLVPVIIDALGGIADFVAEIAPVVAERLPGLITELLPKFLNAAGTMVAGIVEALPAMLEAIVTVAGSVVDSISDYLNEKSPILGAAFDALVDLGRTAFDTLGNLWNGEGGLKEKWEEINVWVSETLAPAVSEAWTGIKDTIGGIFTNIVELWNGEGGLEGVWNGIVEFITGTLKPQFEEQFNAVKDIVSTAFTSIKNVWTNDLSPALDELWKAFKENIMPILNDVAIKFSNFRTNILKKLADFIQGPVSEAWSTLTGFFEDVLVPIVETVSSYFLVLYEEVISPLYDFMIENFDKVWKQFTDWWKETGAPKMYELKQAFKTFKENYLEPLSAKIVIFKSVMNTLWENILKPVATWITDTFQVAIEGLEGAFSGLIDFLTGVFTGDWEKAWDGIKEIFGSVWDAIVDLAKGPINSVIEFINTLIDAVEGALNTIIGGFNRIHVSIPNWVPKFGGRSFGISIDPVSWGRIDYLAKGGHLLRGDAIVGEKGPELLHRENGQTTVIPLSGGERDIDGLMGGNTYNFNIYPSPAQSPLEIAQEVQRIFVEWEHQKEVAHV